MMVQVKGSLSSSEFTIRGFVSKGRATFGVDIQAACPAPIGETIRVYIDLLDDVPLPPEFIPDLFSFLEPFFPGRRKEIAIGHNGANSRIIFASIPRDTDGADNHFGHDSLSPDLTSNPLITTVETANTSEAA